MAGSPVYANLAKMPHLMVAGATGSEIRDAAFNDHLFPLPQSSGDVGKLLIVDPKRVELSIYNGIPHLLTPPITEAKKQFRPCGGRRKKMERRYEVLSQTGVRDIAGYNEKIGRIKKRGLEANALSHYHR